MRDPAQRNGKTKRRIGADVDEGCRLQEEILELEEEQRILRAKLVAAGQPGLARKFLRTPSGLEDLAGFLWRNEAFVAFYDSARPATAAASRPKQFRAKFKLERRDGENARRSIVAHRRKRFAAKFFEPLARAHWAKLKSNFYERVRQAQKKGGGNLPNFNEVIRQFLLQFEWLYPLEEWAQIFPDAALAGDGEFIREIEAAHRGKTASALNPDDRDVAHYWYGFELLGLADKVPPLEHWSDKAACEFIDFISGKPLKLSTYQMRKQRLGLRSKKPTLVSFAEYTYEGKTHALNCRR